MATKYKRDDFDILSYKVDTLERRLENIEKALLSMQHNGKGDINAELLHMLVDMIKQKNKSPPRQRASSPIQQHATETTTQSQEATKETGDLFGFQRRRSIM